LFRSLLFRRPIGHMARRADEIDDDSGAAHNPTPDLRPELHGSGLHAPISGRRTRVARKSLIAPSYPRFR
jgi:hypothetical protein